jgi:glucokinase
VIVVVHEVGDLGFEDGLVGVRYAHAALAEHAFGVGRGAKRLVLVAVGTGIGLGCRGCLETKPTAPALEREANRVARENPGTVVGRVLVGSAAERVSVSDVKAAADAGDDTARGLLAEAGRWLGIGLATFAATFSPDVIVLGGGMAEMGPALVGAAIVAFADTACPTSSVAFASFRPPWVTTRR